MSKQTFLFMIVSFGFYVTLECAVSPEYIYPVGSVFFEGEEKLCVLHQEGTHLELFLWDPITHIALRGLSHFIPAALTILPSRNGFSFIDHERIRIKMINMRSPKTVEVLSLYDFGLLHWIDDAHCYCSAREGKYHRIFHITTEGDCYRLVKPSHDQYFYPQKIDEKLFYIKRDQKET